uniref:Hexosyltransferase n=1 Tax=Astyanax mexicanus TaxID=7994 RepID=A0A8B9H2D8_ASTMX
CSSFSFVFAVASDDNCEFWLSQDDSPHNLKLRAYVGKTGKEWTAPGEYGKFASQISQPVLLEKQKRYFFELIHKQDSHGTDHVEVVVSSYAVSSFVYIPDESTFKMNYVSHIPQTAASNKDASREASGPTPPHGADMLREDPRDTFFQVPLLDKSRLWGVLPECSYKPTYILKGYTLQRYQGLQFVHLLYVYPNDYTRLTHMENENKCFYQEKSEYLERYGFSSYMTLDQPEREDIDTRNGGTETRLCFNDFKHEEYHNSVLQDTEHLDTKKKVTKSHLLNSSPEQRHKGIVAPPIEESNNTWRRVGRLEGKVDEDAAEEEKNLSKFGEEDETVDDWMMYGDLDDDFFTKIGFDAEVNWAQTFQVKPMDFQTMRSDWIDLTCNVSGNLLIDKSEAMFVVQFSMQQIVNVEKRPDVPQGTRYLLELDLLDRAGNRVRLAQYIYLLRKDQKRSRSVYKQKYSPQLLFCNPHNFQWNPTATVHFIIPVKNQARWVQQFIADMEELYKATGDKNFNIIVTDFSSTDMDVQQALEDSQLPRYQYLRLEGNFQRSAGLQAGIDLIENKHSIVFLCDLHIHFPLGFIDSVRKHCVEGRMTFAPIVMRLNCGATPQEPDGYWEVNGFGLMGIYKSDLDSIGGMNTKDFTDRWGGEDWELLDRILEAGLEVERMYLKNFFHYYHSKRGMWNRRIIRNT